ncbi:DUF1269 domain-containing protein [Nonomuraea sp. NBC_01738]|uniref:DUF6325 family protein n=1 Tax=Nonomuraea sp. NBC_01738 TaxID=2976003 RepID=UPI002E0ED5AD|nr:DUF1269 domain-containing protein [Nonomuraea sp. NBC_01738]
MKAETVGPVDVAVITFDGDRFDEGVASAIRELQEKGTIRIVDLSFVRKASDGTATAVEVADSEVAGSYAGLADEELDLLNDEDLRLVSEALDPGSAALVVVWENTWAAELGTALRAANSKVAMLERIPRPVVQQALRALEEV